jgi:tRNA uridine 5-carbamoylmethylation protein Kti12
VRGVVLFGPTSSGKTGLSLDLAARYRAQGCRPVVLNADSRQVYRYMDVGTSKELGTLTKRDLSTVRDAALDHIVADTRRQRSWFNKLAHALPPRGGDAAQWIVEQG